MSEGHNFENQEILPQPKEDQRSALEFLEKGELLKARPLEGWTHISVVDIKDDGKALFKPDKEKEKIQTELELLAFMLDKILGFELIPAVVSRKLEGNEGTFQSFISDAELAYDLFGSWEGLVNKEELLKAAVFDYLIKAGDRHELNFLINIKTGKIWLIDHDNLMFGDICNDNIISSLLEVVIRKNLNQLSPEILESVRKLLDRINSLSSSDNPKIQKILDGIKERAGRLIEDKKITSYS